MAEIPKDTPPTAPGSQPAAAVPDATPVEAPELIAAGASERLEAEPTGTLDPSSENLPVPGRGEVYSVDR